jgi:uncharacterized membrane protein YraQ (UPF0718 family)
MIWKSEWKWLLSFVLLYFLLYFLPVGIPRFDEGVTEALQLTKWYTREHIVFCLIPAFFIAGAISVFVRQDSIMKYFGARANKLLSYGVASISGAILAVCSCTILPLFAGIYKRGAGLGPAIAFLYSGPAINVLAIILTARILGLELGLARAIGAIVFSVVIGFMMHLFFIKEENQKYADQIDLPEVSTTRPLWQTVLYFAAMCGVLIFANWSEGTERTGFFHMIFSIKWPLTCLSAIVLGIALVLWFGATAWKIGAVCVVTALSALIFNDMPTIPFCIGLIGLSWTISFEEGELNDWMVASWDLTKQIFPLLLAGVLVSGFFLGRPGYEGLIPASWIEWAVGGNTFTANFFSAIVAAFMYFATLTEVPILQGLMNSGMGKGPALALLLAGPALSLPSMLVLKSIMGTRKTVVYVSIVVIMSTMAGIFYGNFF